MLSTEHVIKPPRPPVLRIANFQPALITDRAAKFRAALAGKNSEFLVSIFTCCLLLFPGWGFSMGTKYHFHSWRVFVLVCALPCIASLVALKFMPESPRFLLEVRWFISNVAVWYQERMGRSLMCHCLSFFVPSNTPSTSSEGKPLLHVYTSSTDCLKPKDCRLWGQSLMISVSLPLGVQKEGSEKWEFNLSNKGTLKTSHRVWARNSWILVEEQRAKYISLSKILKPQKS